MLPFAHNQNGTRRVPHYLLGDASNEDVGESGAAMGRDDDHVNGKAARRSDNLGGRRASADESVYWHLAPRLINCQSGELLLKDVVGIAQERRVFDAAEFGQGVGRRGDNMEQRNSGIMFLRERKRVLQGLFCAIGKIDWDENPFDLKGRAVS